MSPSVDPDRPVGRALGGSAERLAPRPRDSVSCVIILQGGPLRDVRMPMPIDQKLYVVNRYDETYFYERLSPTRFAYTGRSE